MGESVTGVIIKYLVYVCVCERERERERDRERETCSLDRKPHNRENAHYREYSLYTTRI